MSEYRRGKTDAVPHRWLVTTAVHDPRFSDGRPMTYGENEEGVRERIWEYDGYAAVVVAEDPQGAVEAGMDKIAAEYRTAVECSGCGGFEVAQGVDVIDLDAVLAAGLLRHYDNGGVWRECPLPDPTDEPGGDR